jgi:hypothetical protein
VDGRLRVAAPGSSWLQREFADRLVFSNKVSILRRSSSPQVKEAADFVGRCENYDWARREWRKRRGQQSSGSPAFNADRVHRMRSVHGRSWAFMGSGKGVRMTGEPRSWSKGYFSLSLSWPIRPASAASLFMNCVYSEDCTVIELTESPDWLCGLSG